MAYAGNKTEKPTPQRLKKAREQGQFLASRGFIQGAQFLAFVVALGKLGPAWIGNMRVSMAALISHAMQSEFTGREWIFLIRQLLLDTLRPILLIVLIVLAVGTALHLATTQLGFSLSRLKPKFDRLNPANNFKGMLGRGLQPCIESVVLLALLGITVYVFASDHGADLLRLPFQSVQAGSASVAASLDGMLWRAAGVFVLFGSIDLFRQYRKHSSQLRMSREEIREENKRNEGDPQIKARIRRLRRELLRRQMMSAVPKATAVIVNPTHYAVAIRYEPAMASPVVVAKGKNWLALRIRQIAVENQVPIIENPPLARALYTSIEVGKTIPPEFYKAIAEILAYIYRLMGRKLQD